MKVSTLQPFEIIYSLSQHEYMGYILESFAVQLDENGKITLQHQNISPQNAKEFEQNLDKKDYDIIQTLDEMNQGKVMKKYSKKKINPEDFFLSIYDKEKGNKLIQSEIERYLERRRAKALNLLATSKKRMFEMGNDGNPAWNELNIKPEKASVLFHFRRNEENTHYFPTIKYAGSKLEFNRKEAYIICSNPAWMVLKNSVYTFKKSVDGKKLNPFLKKKFIAIPRKVEEDYYRKFVAPLVASFDVYARGFDINTMKVDPKPTLIISELMGAENSTGLFGSGNNTLANNKMLLELNFNYGSYRFKADTNVAVNVNVEKKENSYVFHRVIRKKESELHILKELNKRGLNLRNAKISWHKSLAFDWINTNREYLNKEGIELVQQASPSGKKYFLGQTSIDIQIHEKIDWFDINATIRFGEFEITLKELKQLINKRTGEIKLPNGEEAIIPESWKDNYAELFSFAEEISEGDMVLKKHHLSLIQGLQNGNLAKVSMDRKLARLHDFDDIEDFPIPSHFEGQLRAYQKAGYNWLMFLNHYKFGGCLADDMGLGKTVQTLAMLQAQKEHNGKHASLLIMPTSLIYNWEKEAARFTPSLKPLIYVRSDRSKNVSQFQDYDLVITTYGITRMDVDILSQYYFNYIILDESQAIKNPESIIARSTGLLKSKYKLVLTGTPIENSTLDIWSQMNFVNPGLLGSETFFKNEFLNPIEKKQDERKMQKLHGLIKPFILRRHKSQVATDLPEKIEKVHYSVMTPEQGSKYEEAKVHYRNLIFAEIYKKGARNSSMIILQGLTQLRQIANHPRMIDPQYEASSGKFNDMKYMLENAIREDHKILIFSQFVKHLSLIREILEEMRQEYTYLDGSTRNRQQQVERFQQNDDLKIFLISLKAGGIGLNLTGADYVFILDPWWNPAVEAQAIDRAYRIGQTKKVFTYKFITRDTVEEKILALQERKSNLSQKLISTEDSFMKTLTKSDIESLLI